MWGFARRTGLEPLGTVSTRYLWTDAFAVCNFLGLSEEEGDAEALWLAVRLVDETHRVLGRHRSDDTRQGWISGLDDAKGAAHPTVGGLRIGKDLPERCPDEPLDANLEWERDGQYFHYLTKWMHALDSVSRVTQQPHYRHWAIELAQRAYAAFAIRDSAGSLIGLHWKMSIDLRRPLVPSMGQHDPLDALMVYSHLQGRPVELGDGGLSRQIRQVARVCSGCSWYTGDTLGVGGLLTDAYRLVRRMADGAMNEPLLLGALIEASTSGTSAIVHSRALDGPAEARLPFRELGLSIGIRAATRLVSCIHDVPAPFERVDSLEPLLGALPHLEGLASRIEGFWLESRNQDSPSWTGHREINEVMLATSLAPYGYLEI
jgi:hypothetical protein